MKVIIFGNKKGGVGKTMTAKGIAEYIAAIEKKKVLIIDLDPQCNISGQFLKMVNMAPNSSGTDWIPPEHPDMDDIIKDNQDDDELANWDGISTSADIYLQGWAQPYPTQNKLIDVIPGHSLNLDLVERQRSLDVQEKIINQLVAFIDMYSENSEYDYCIIDTPPRTGPVVQSALHSGTHIVIPCIPERMSIEGIHGVASSVHQANIAREKGRIKIAGILPNKVKPNTKIHKDWIERLQNDEDTNKHLLNGFLKDRIGYADSAEQQGNSLITKPSSPEVKAEFINVAKEIMERINE